MRNDICLSVVVPVYNVAGFLDKCIDSLLKAEGISSTEIILVDDGSTDESLIPIRRNMISFPVITRITAVCPMREITVSNALMADMFSSAILMT